ncbi:MAG: diaminopimelate decarboxylase [Acidobacteria bacterium]|nr:diaminopimelate decarboxylase [Acidobacteriota bacterium]
MTPLQGFERRDGALYCEQVALATIAAEVGTPTYVYSASAIAANYRAYDEALQGAPHEVHYAVKANSSLAVLALLAREGAGFDIVSGGELYRVIQAGGDPRRTVFSGVGKTAEEIEYALESGVGSFNCESEGELALLRDLADRLGRRPSVALRVNPDISAETHPYISTGLTEHKFGIPLEQAERIYGEFRRYAPLALDGVSCHIGSQIFDLGAFQEASAKMLGLIDRLAAAGLSIRRLDLGGGLGVSYKPGQISGSIAEYGRRLREALAGRGFELQLEPGRSIVGQAGALLTRSLYRKQNGEKVFVIVDAAMNDLIRPSLYQAHHEILPVVEAERPRILGDVVGPVCESGDFLARDRALPDVLPGELLAVATAGAYGFVLSSNYNSRPRAAEVLVEGDQWRVIRERETFRDLIRGETC